MGNKAHKGQVLVKRKDRLDSKGTKSSIMKIHILGRGQKSLRTRITDVSFLVITGGNLVKSLKGPGGRLS